MKTAFEEAQEILGTYNQTLMSGVELGRNQSQQRIDQLETTLMEIKTLCETEVAHTAVIKIAAMIEKVLTNL